MKVPDGKVLVVGRHDSFTSETFFTLYGANTKVPESEWKSGVMLHEGESITIREVLRHDGPGEPRDHTYTDFLVTNKGGKAVSKKVREERR